MKHRAFILFMVACITITVLMTGCIGKGNAYEFTKWDKEFTLHGGVEFGDTLEEAREKEINAGMECTELSEGDRSFRVDGIVAGFSDSHIFYFCENGNDFGINAALYDIDNDANKPDILYNADLVTEALKTKYGSPYFVFDGENLPPLKTSRVHFTYENLLGYEPGRHLSPDFEIPSDLNYEIPVYEMWILDVGDNECVLIEHVVSGRIGNPSIHSIEYNLLEEESIIADMSGEINLTEAQMEEMTGDL